MTPRADRSAALHVLRELAASPLADRVRVYGSVMRGDPNAGDVDTVLDLDAPRWTGGARPADHRDARGCVGVTAEDADALAYLLSLVRHGPTTADGRPVLNAFLRNEGRLLAPNGSRTWWVPAAEGVLIWAKACMHGVPLDRLQGPWSLDRFRSDEDAR